MSISQEPFQLALKQGCDAQVEAMMPRQRLLAGLLGLVPVVVVLALLLGFGAWFSGGVSSAATPGATYSGTVDVGGTVRLRVNGDGTALEFFEFENVPFLPCFSSISVNITNLPLTEDSFDTQATISVFNPAFTIGISGTVGAEMADGRFYNAGVSVQCIFPPDPPHIKFWNAACVEACVAPTFTPTDTPPPTATDALTPTPTPTGTPSGPTATPTKQPEPGDTDGDGCSDQRENGPDQFQGGRRNYLYEWDYYDVNGDRHINIPGDIIAVANVFGRDRPGYTPQHDRSRGPPPGVDPDDPDNNEQWDLGPPDGVINIPDDILGVANQFGHTCE